MKVNTNYNKTVDILLTAAEKLSKGQAEKKKFKNYSYLIGRNESDTPFFIPYSTSSKKKVFFERPVLMGKGQSKKAYKCIEYTRQGKTERIFKKAIQKSSDSKITFHYNMILLRDVNRPTGHPHLEKAGIEVNCERGVMIGDLCDGDLKNTHKRRPPQQILKMIRDIASAEQYIIDLGYYHLDLSLHNLLVKGEDAIVSDLDEAYHINEGLPGFFAHNPGYSAYSMVHLINNGNQLTPELLKLWLQKEIVFQMAVIFLSLNSKYIITNERYFEFVSGQFWKDNPAIADHQKDFTFTYLTVTEENRLNLKNYLSTKYSEANIDFILKCLDQDPSKRPQVKDFMNCDGALLLP